MKQTVTIPSDSGQPIEVKCIRLSNGNLLVPKRKENNSHWVEAAPGTPDYERWSAVAASHYEDARNTELVVHAENAVGPEIQVVVGPRVQKPPKIKRWDVLEKLVHAHHWTKGAEIGVRQGTTTLHLLRTCPSLHMTAIDLFEARPGLEAEGGASMEEWNLEEEERRLRKTFAAKYAGRATLVKADSVIAARDIADGSLDFAFIDADHREAAVRADIAAWRPKIRAGGMLLGHDARDKFPGVMAAINDMCPGWTKYSDNVWGIQV
jgi:predicted O-methyltransferase YrrM